MRVSILFSLLQTLSQIRAQYSSRDLLNEITNFGLNRSRFLTDIEEKRLYQGNFVLGKNAPGHYVGVFNKQQKKAKQISEFGYATVEASALMSKHFKLTRQQVVYGLEKVELRSTRLFRECPLREEDNEVRSNRVPKQEGAIITRSSCESQTQIYRSTDGTCNNLDHPDWGSAFMPFYRFLPPDYSDGVQTMRRSYTGHKLPSPRKVSGAVHKQSSSDSRQFTMLIMQWGQFIDHDLTSTPQSRGFNNSILKCCNSDGSSLTEDDLHPDCWPIEIPRNDYFYSDFRASCMEFVRSSPAARRGCTLGPRDQINQITSYLDASNIYGSSLKDEKSLRLYSSGKLKYTDLHIRKSLLPPLDPHLASEECHISTRNLHCFHAGDARVNEQPGLAGMHTIWLREHNRIAEKLASINSHWDDEKIYQETRKIVGALHQHITYNEWLPVILGPRVLEIFDLELLPNGFYKNYNKSVNPTIANAFAAAAFRFGHSLVKNSISRCNKDFQQVPFFVKLHKEFNNPSNLHNFGSVDRIMLGFLTEKASKRDEFISEELTNRLFQVPSTNYGMDLASLNIQRGRDHGIPSYNIWREQCGLRRFDDWSDANLVISPETLKRFSRVYEHFDDVDLFTGGLSEHPVTGGLVGPTFACILGQQFLNLRQGDRFWYENENHPGAFSEKQLQEIRRVTISSVICNNLDDIDNIQPFAFFSQDDDQNKRISCSKIPKLRLNPWRERNFVFRNEFLQFRHGSSANSDLKETSLPPIDENPTEEAKLFDINSYLSRTKEGADDDEIDEFPKRITKDNYLHAFDGHQKELVYAEDKNLQRDSRAFDFTSKIKPEDIEKYVNDLF